MQTEKFSYSKLEVFNQCPMKFKLKYEDKNFSSKTSLALELGTLLHKGKELIGNSLMNNIKINYKDIENLINEGYNEKENKRQSQILGIKDLKEKYFFEWVEKDSKSNMNYDEKIQLYVQHLKDMEEDKEWKPIACELLFTFLFQDKYLFNGYIDKIDSNKEDELRLTDYKSSKAIYPDAEIKTPLQMVIYDLAIQQEMKKIPKVHIYDFILLNKQQEACSKGYLKRGQNKLDKIFNSLEECRNTKIYTPKPSPLCHWCDFCKTNANAEDKYKFLCPYHSLWLPEQKTYEVNQKFNVEDNKGQDKATDFWF